MVVHFCGMDHQKSNFLLILAHFLSEAVEASRCYFFINQCKKHKCPHLLKPLGTVIQQNYWSFYPSEPIQKACFNMRHPVVKHIISANFQQCLSQTTFQKPSKYQELQMDQRVKRVIFCEKSKQVTWSLIKGELLQQRKVG